MIILSWNIQKITEEKAAQFAPLIGKVINEVSGGKPFVLVVYENKTKADKVLESIGTGIHASGLKTQWAHTGGTPQLRENILFIAGNGATVDKPEHFTGWQQDFDDKCGQLYRAEIDSAKSEVVRQNALTSRPPRAAIAEGRNAAVASATAGTFRPADHFRNPIMVTARADGVTTKFLALHAPGPQSGDDHEEPFARTYAEAVLRNAGEFDMVLGDFNVRTHEVDSGGFVDQSVRLGATTKGSEDGRHTFSRLDRVYARPGLALSTALLSDGQEKVLTDHHCLAVKVEPKQAQTVLTSFFPYLASPERQQAVVYENYKRAFESRTANLQPKMDEGN